MRHLLVFVLMLLAILLIIPTSPTQAANPPSFEFANRFYPDPLYSVDIKINGGCEPLNIGPGESYFKHNFATGTYTIVLSEGDGIGTPTCTGAVIQQYTVAYTQGEFYTVYIHPDQSNAAGVSLHKNDVSAVPSGYSRLFVRNAVGNRTSISLHFRAVGKGRPYVVNVPNGGLVTLELPVGDWEITLKNPPPAVMPSQAFRQGIPYSSGELWHVEVAGPVNQGVLGIFDYRYVPPNN